MRRGRSCYCEQEQILLRWPWGAYLHWWHLGNRKCIGWSWWNSKGVKHGETWLAKLRSRKPCSVKEQVFASKVWVLHISISDMWGWPSDACKRQPLLCDVLLCMVCMLLSILVSMQISMRFQVAKTIQHVLCVCYSHFMLQIIIWLLWKK